MQACQSLRRKSVGFLEQLKGSLAKRAAIRCLAAYMGLFLVLLGSLATVLLIGPAYGTNLLCRAIPGYRALVRGILGLRPWYLRALAASPLYLAGLMVGFYALLFYYVPKMLLLSFLHGRRRDWAMATADRVIFYSGATDTLIVLPKGWPVSLCRRRRWMSFFFLPFLLLLPARRGVSFPLAYHESWPPHASLCRVEMSPEVANSLGIEPVEEPPAPQFWADLESRGKPAQDTPHGASTPSGR
ncbi:MAG TPA: hypothetical protein VNE39_08560 [Planctomycetota bacterium]|nr:hypothetical protein [Planctomycetota bacterium]